MDDIDDILERLRAAATAVLSDEPVAFAFLFGSHATATATPRSDIDIAVHLAADAPTGLDTLALRLRLAARLETSIGHGPVEVVVLDEVPLTLAGRVQETGQVIHSADDVLRVRYASATSRRYHDFKIHESRSARERLAGYAAGG